MNTDKYQYDLTKQTDVEQYMACAANESHWNKLIDDVKAANGGAYPSFWYASVIASGLAGRIAATWGGDADIHIVTFK